MQDWKIDMKAFLIYSFSAVFYNRNFSSRILDFLRKVLDFAKLLFPTVQISTMALP